MNIKRILFVFFVLGCIFHSGNLSAQPEQSEQLLKRVDSCRVLVTPESSSLAKYTDLWVRMEKDIAQILNGAGLNAEPARQQRGKTESGTSEYNVEVSRFDTVNPRRIIFLVKTKVTVDVLVNKRTGKSLRVDGWIKGECTQTKELADMGLVIASLVFKQAGEFVSALADVNNPSVVPDTNEPSSRTNKDENGKDYKYVASKHSRIFHKPDCVWAERIKEENLVKYKTRQEAIDDGKRPCKRCKP